MVTTGEKKTEIKKRIRKFERNNSFDYRFLFSGENLGVADKLSTPFSVAFSVVKLKKFTLEFSKTFYFV